MGLGVRVADFSLIGNTYRHQLYGADGVGFFVE
jgi:hypothetical protein